MRKSDKRKNIEEVNKRLLNESLPPLINFTEHEVFSILWETYGENIPKELIKSMQEALKKKGRVFPTGDIPKGAFM